MTGLFQGLVRGGGEAPQGKQYIKYYINPNLNRVNTVLWVIKYV